MSDFSGLPERNLPDWIDGFMLLTENSEPPILYRKWSAVSAIASALQRKCRIEIGISLVFYPNFYIVLVGPSATGKGTAMKYAYDILERIPNIKLSAQATSLQALIRRLQRSNETDIELYTGNQVYHSSLTIFSEEFTVFLGYHNRELMASLCNWYDCPKVWTYDTIKRSEETVIGAWVNLIAGTTPDNIQSSFPMEAIGGGLSSRIIFVNEDKKNKLVIFPSSSPEEIKLQELLANDLEQIALLGGAFKFTREAIAYYTNWCIEQDSTPPFHNPKFDGYCGRRRNHLLTLSMICSASRSNDMIIDDVDIARSSTMLEEVELKMSTVFRGIGKSDIASLINDAIIYFENSEIPEVPLWQFARDFEGNVDKIMMERILYTLEEAKYIRVIKKHDADTMIYILGEERR